MFHPSYVILKIRKVENRVDPDEVAHHEPPRLDLRCSQSGLCLSFLTLKWLSWKRKKYCMNERFTLALPATYSRTSMARTHLEP